jgi:hypothetical protein
MCRESVQDGERDIEQRTTLESKAPGTSRRGRHCWRFGVDEQRTVPEPQMTPTVEESHASLGQGCPHRPRHTSGDLHLVRAMSITLIEREDIRHAGHCLHVDRDWHTLDRPDGVPLRVMRRLDLE